jgi:hypothetical protein
MQCYDKGRDLIGCIKSVGGDSPREWRSFRNAMSRGSTLESECMGKIFARVSPFFS